VLFVRNRLKVAGSFAVKVQLISVTSPEVGLVGTAMVNKHASGEEAMQGCDVSTVHRLGKESNDLESERTCIFEAGGRWE
jgi:hypothetical protein